MAQHGVATPTAAQTAAQTAAMRERITLAQPRPDGLRTANYYTETPLRPPKCSPKPTKDLAASDHGEPAAVHRAPARSGHAPVLLPSPRSVHPERRPPPCVTFMKGKSSTSPSTTTTTQDTGRANQTSDLSPSPHRGDSSILCADCGRCQCDACRQPRSLPSKWICDKKYECSAEALLDTCTCMCCVKGIFYHCTKDYDMDDDVSCADNPCTCGPDRRCVRWSCMGALALFLPCLLCYWPMKACVSSFEACYAKYNSQGCECTTHPRLVRMHLPNQNKRLLDPEGY